MKRSHRNTRGWIGLTGLMALTTANCAEWTTVEAGGRVEAKSGDTLVAAWQAKPLDQPKGGAKFAGSAFFHPLRTPGGFEFTAVQPSDHLHHLGLWWPWKFIEVGGAKYNTWELQEGQGAHQAVSCKRLDAKAGEWKWEFQNRTVIKPQGGGERAAILETATVTLAMHGKDAVVMDLLLDQRAAGEPVTVVNYRYSGFSWRGPLSWNKGNSRMTTSEGLDRNKANGKPARWVVVSGATPQGSASVLLMTAAATPEKLRVWDDTMTGGNPFVNFNPVTDKALPLDAEHPAVSKRRYRVIAADRTIDATAAEAEWKAWMKP
jgi:hypothetical protein